MYRLKKHIIHFTLGMILAVLAIANASAQVITIEECDSMSFEVVSRPSIPDSYFDWGIYNATPGETDMLDPNTTLDPVLYFVGEYLNTGRKVTVTNLPPGKYYVRIHVWDEISCTDNVEMYLLHVLEKELDFTMETDSVCIGDPTFVKIIFSGAGPYTIHYTIGDAVTPSTYNLNGDIVGPEITIPITDPLPVGETSFWIMDIVDGTCKTYEYTEDERPGTGIVIYPKPAKQPIYLKEE